jgi:hypothetical protein
MALARVPWWGLTQLTQLVLMQLQLQLQIAVLCEAREQQLQHHSDLLPGESFLVRRQAVALDASPQEVQGRLSRQRASPSYAGVSVCHPCGHDEWRPLAYARAGVVVAAMLDVTPGADDEVYQAATTMAAVEHASDVGYTMVHAGAAAVPAETMGNGSHDDELAALVVAVVVAVAVVFVAASDHPALKESCAHPALAAHATAVKLTHEHAQSVAAVLALAVDACAATQADRAGGGAAAAADDDDDDDYADDDVAQQAVVHAHIARQDAALAARIQPARGSPHHHHHHHHHHHSRRDVRQKVPEVQRTKQLKAPTTPCQHVLARHGQREGDGRARTAPARAGAESLQLPCGGQYDASGRHSRIDELPHCSGSARAWRAQMSVQSEGLPTPVQTTKGTTSETHKHAR